MEPLIIKATDDTPSIILDSYGSNFEISGRSLPEEVISFYLPVMKWLDMYVANPNNKTVFKLKLDYINSASQRAIHEILSTIEKIKITGREVEVEWYFIEDDDEMRETGEEYSELINIPFIFKSYIQNNTGASNRLSVSG
jgi:hypothetical protein